MLICLLSMLAPLFCFDSIIFFWFFLFFVISLLKTYMFYFDGLFFSDFLTFVMIFISICVFFVSLLSTMSSKMSMLLSLMMSLIILSFHVFNGFFFYVLFEFSFILMFLFLVSWGESLERLSASFYMLFYTLVFSLPFLILILNEVVYGSMSYFLFSFGLKKDFTWVFMILVFAVKLPLFSFHSWLPKAHVESPTPGSMVLAGVLLKLGGYGFIRFLALTNYFNLSNNILLNHLLSISLGGCLLVCLLIMRQVDLKMFIAYSSIVHMSMGFMGFLAFSFTGEMGFVLMMMAHGFISPLLFFLMGIFYKSSYTRSLFSLKGSLGLSSYFTFLWLISSILNTGFPPFMSFLSELMLASSFSFLSLFQIFLLLILFFFTGVYGIFLYTSVSCGESFSCSPLNICFLHMILSFFLIYPVLMFVFIPFLF